MKKLLAVINMAALSFVINGCVHAPPFYQDTFTGESWYALTTQLVIVSWVNEVDYGRKQQENRYASAYRQTLPYGDPDYPGYLHIMKREAENEILITFTFSSPKKYNLKSISFRPPRATSPQELDGIESTGQVLTTAISIYDGNFNGNSIRVFKNPYCYEEQLQGKIPCERFQEIIEADGIIFRAIGENDNIDFFIYQDDLEKIRKSFSNLTVH